MCMYTCCSPSTCIYRFAKNRKSNFSIWKNTREWEKWRNVFFFSTRRIFTPRYALIIYTYHISRRLFVLKKSIIDYRLRFRLLFRYVIQTHILLRTTMTTAMLFKIIFNERKEKFENDGEVGVGGGGRETTYIKRWSWWWWWIMNRAWRENEKWREKEKER